MYKFAASCFSFAVTPLLETTAFKKCYEKSWSFVKRVLHVGNAFYWNYPQCFQQLE